MKFLNKKRVASIALAGVLALSTAVPAFALGGSTTVTGTYNDVKLAVTVPTSGKAYINPYGLPITLGETFIANQQITTIAPLTIQNKSQVGLAVKANLKVTATGATLVNIGDATSTNTKQVAVRLEVFEAPTLTADTIEDTETLNATFAALKTADAVIKLPATTTNNPSTGGGSGDDSTENFVLREGDTEGNVQAGGAAFFRLAGEVSELSASTIAGGTDWTKTDGFSATIAWTFTPQDYVKDGGTLTVTTVTTAAAGTATLAWPQALKDAKIYPASATWTCSDSNITVTPGNTTWGKATTEVKADVSAVSAAITSTASTAATITVKVVGTDGITYTATSDGFTVAS